jgi:hypothetical protein
MSDTARRIPRHADEPKEPLTPANLGPGTALEVVDFGEDAGAGMEGARSEELLTPFLGLIQALSPQVDPSSPSYQETAKVGMMINTMTGELFDGKTGLDVIPVARDYMYGEWVPRSMGGGFRGQLGPDDNRVRSLIQTQGRFKPLDTGEGTELVEQFNLFALIAPPPLSEENAEQVVIAFTSSKISVYKRLFTRIGSITYPVNGRMIQPPIWAHRWRLTSVPQKNAQGQPFYNFQFELAGGTSPRASLIRPNEPIYGMAKHFSEMVRSGQAKANFVAAEGAATDQDVPPF